MQTDLLSLFAISTSDICCFYGLYSLFLCSLLAVSTFFVHRNTEEPNDFYRLVEHGVGSMKESKANVSASNPFEEILLLRIKKLTERKNSPRTFA